MLQSLGSRRYLIIGLAAMLLAGIAWVYLARSSGAPESPGLFSVTALHADVFVKEPNVDFVLIPGQATTTSGSSIRTSSTGRALIESSAAHRTLIDYSSEIVLSEDADRTGVGLLAGAVWSRLAKVFDSGEYYEIKTGNAIAAVRGTSFGMWYTNGITTLIVTEGSVDFSALDPETGLPVPGTEVVVVAGQKAVCDANGKITVTDLTKEDHALPWVLFNNSDESPSKTPSVVPSSNPAPGSPAGVPSEPSSAPTAPSEPSLSLVSPSEIDEGSNERITLKGNNLQGVTSVQAGSKNVRFEVLNTTTVIFYANDMPPGRYDVTVVGPAGSDALSRALTVHEVVPEQSPDYNQDPPIQ